MRKRKKGRAQTCQIFLMVCVRYGHLQVSNGARATETAVIKRDIFVTAAAGFFWSQAATLCPLTRVLRGSSQDLLTRIGRRSRKEFKTECARMSRRFSHGFHLDLCQIFLPIWTRSSYKGFYKIFSPSPEQDQAKTSCEDSLKFFKKIHNDADKSLLEGPGQNHGNTS
jgi:hypothetical protein